MARQHEQPERPTTLTASLTTGVARVTHGRQESVSLIDEILTLDHINWETTLSVGDVEFHSTKQGPYPNHQLRISVRPSAGVAALNFTDHADPKMSIGNSYNPNRPLPDVDLIFSGATGAVFPRTAVIPIADAREALTEWLETRKHQLRTGPNPMSQDVEPLLRELLRRRWTMMCFGRRTQPDALAAVHQDQHWTDVVILRGPDRAAAYRAPTQPHHDPLHASEVVWHYLANADHTLRAVLSLPPDTAVYAPYPIPEECRIPEAHRRPVTIRLLSLGRSPDQRVRGGLDRHERFGIACVSERRG